MPGREKWWGGKPGPPLHPHPPPSPLPVSPPPDTHIQSGTHRWHKLLHALTATNILKELSITLIDIFISSVGSFSLCWHGCGISGALICTRFVELVLNSRASFECVSVMVRHPKTKGYTLWQNTLPLFKKKEKLEYPPYVCSSNWRSKSKHSCVLTYRMAWYEHGPCQEDLGLENKICVLYASSSMNDTVTELSEMRCMCLCMSLK